MDCPGSDASDSFEFEADGREAEVVFHCVTTTTTLPCQPGRDYSCQTTTTTILALSSALR